MSNITNQIKINKAYIASCTNGLEELKQAAKIIEGKKVASWVKFIIIPSTKKIYQQALKNGYIDILRKAGASVKEEFTCGPCIGDGPYVVNENEIAISATNRNFFGRMGDKSAQVYLGGINLVVLSAILGHISTTKDYNKVFHNN